MGGTPNYREMKVLRGLYLGNVGPPSYFVGVGPKTFKNMLNNGWIVQAGEDPCGAQGYKITEAGLEVFQVQRARHRRERQAET
jgi:hypothetical protein